MQRAAATRQHGSRDKVSLVATTLFREGMDGLFNQRPPPPTFDHGDVFDSDGDLNPEVFRCAVTHIKSSSSPGFPFHFSPRNETINLIELYEAVNTLLGNWKVLMNNDDFLNMPILEGEPRQEFARALLVNNIAPCASVFIKSEPTKMDKQARLIYGVSILLNIISRIIFGDFLNELTDSWYTTCHKVGMDFTSDPGLQKLSSYAAKMEQCRASLPGRAKIVSDDIQGWEYQSRPWMHRAWHDSYLTRAKATDFHRRLQTCYARVEEYVAIAFDRQVLVPDFYITLSGRVTTHVQNSDERAALAFVDLVHEMKTVGLMPPEDLAMQPYTMTNGDDCNRIKYGNTASITEQLGFVHTDVHDEDLTAGFHFSSQFFHYEAGSFDVYLTVSPKLLTHSSQPMSLIQASMTPFCMSATIQLLMRLIGCVAFFRG